MVCEFAMQGSATAVAPPDSMGQPQRFLFVANSRPLFRGTVGAVVILSLILAWVWWSGRIKNVDASYVGLLIAIIALGPPLNLWMRLRAVRRSAASLGHVEFDHKGVRWKRPDGTNGYDIAWDEVEHAKVDAPNFTVVLFRRDGGPATIIGALSQHGVPSGEVILERFGEIVELVSTKVQASPHGQSAERSRAKQDAHIQQAAKRALLMGGFSCLTAASVYVANTALGACLHWTRWLLPMPVLIGGFGLLFLVAGLRLRGGKYPLVSPLYHPSVFVIVFRFLVVASVANFVFAAVANSFYP